MATSTVYRLFGGGGLAFWRNRQARPIAGWLLGPVLIKLPGAVYILARGPCPGHTGLNVGEFRRNDNLAKRYGLAKAGTRGRRIFL